MKNKIKELAQELKEDRAELKYLQRTNANCWQAQSELHFKTVAYRHLHIAYSMARGKEYNQIEKYVRPGNEPSWGAINRWFELYSIKGTA